MHGSKNVPGKPGNKVDLGLDNKTFNELIRKCSKVRRVYEDEDFIIDILKDENGLPKLRVSIFDEHGHFLDEEFVRKKDYLD